MPRWPKDGDPRRIGSRAVAIVHYTFDSTHWEFRQETGNDVGRDCVVELIENDSWNNHKIEGQIKGAISIESLKKCNETSLSIEVKTINYALGSSIPFVLLYVDVTKELVYYLVLQDYFIAHKDLFKKLDGTQEKLNIRIPLTNILNESDEELTSVARITFVDGPGDNLRRYINNQQS